MVWTPHYATGTIGVTNGSATITGTGTAWLSAGLQAGDLVLPLDGSGVAVVSSIDADGQITATASWLSATDATKAYIIMRLPDQVRTSERVRQLLDRLASGQWKSAWATATAYAEFDTVSNNGSMYVCTLDHTSGATTEPGTGASWQTYWDLAVQGYAAVREVLTANRTYYVRADGSDANSGLVDSAAGAFLTIQHAIDVVYGSLDLHGFDVTIQVRNGTYTAPLNVLSPQVGAGNIKLLGDTATPANVTVSTGASTSLYVKGAGTKIFVAGIKWTNASGLAGWYVDAGGSIESFGNNEMGAVGGHHIMTDGPSFIYMSYPLILSGGCAGWHLNSNSNGYIYIQTGSWTIVGSPTCGGFANASAGGVIYAFSNSFTGTFNGARYNASMNGVIQTNGGGASYFPGTSAGSTATGGQYA